LLQTKALLSSEVQRSHLAHEAFNQSTRELKNLTTQYTDLNSLLTSSKNLLGTLVKTQKSDEWYLQTAFYILCVTVGWLVYRRFLYGPTWWLIWLPLKLFYRTIFAVLSITGFRSSNKLPAVSQPIASSASSATSIVMSSNPSASSSSIQGNPPDISGAPEKDPNKDGSLGQKIGQMADKIQGGDKDKEARPVVRADGTVLEERGDKPVNPKKRMFDTNIEKQKQEAGKKDEL